jgi:response regulator NasT
MDQVIVAFESAKNCERVREIIEGSGVASCIVCHSAAEVKRVVSKQRLTTVICGFKLPDETAENLFGDLPPSCSMLMLAVQDLLELCPNDEIFKLSSPVSRSDLTASVRMLLQMSHRLEKYIRPQRSEQETTVINEAKAVLMDRYGMTEAQAHRFLQKKSMDSGAKMVQTARLVLTSQ